MQVVGHARSACIFKAAFMAKLGQENIEHASCVTYMEANWSNATNLSRYVNEKWLDLIELFRPKEGSITCRVNLCHQQYQCKTPPSDSTCACRPQSSQTRLNILWSSSTDLKIHFWLHRALQIFGGLTNCKSEANFHRDNGVCLKIQKFTFGFLFRFYLIF